jgi:PmbA protein
MPQSEQARILTIIENALDRLKKAGADYAEAAYSKSQERIVTVRNGLPHKIEGAAPSYISLHARFNNRAVEREIPLASIQDIDSVMSEMKAMAALKSEFTYDAPADRAQLAKIRTQRKLELYDPTKPTLDSMIERAALAESVALKTPGIVATDGALAVWGYTLMVSASSRGDVFSSKSSIHRTSLTVLAQDGDARQGGFYGAQSRYLCDLKDAAEIGAIAANRAVRAVGAKPAPAGCFPVVFRPDAAAGLIGHFIDAVSSNAMRRKVTFLADKIGHEVFSPDITIANNPHLKRGLASSMFTSAGLPTTPCLLVEKGILKNIPLSLQDARQMDLVGLMPIQGRYNVSIAPGVLSPNELIADIKDGLYVTGASGQGVRIRNGSIDYDHPVDEIIISSNLADMFKNMTPADDLDLKRAAITAPTLRIEGMVIK